MNKLTVFAAAWGLLAVGSGCVADTAADDESTLKHIDGTFWVTGKCAEKDNWGLTSKDGKLLLSFDLSLAPADQPRRHYKGGFESTQSPTYGAAIAAEGIGKLTSRAYAPIVELPSGLVQRTTTARGTINKVTFSDPNKLDALSTAGDEMLVDIELTLAYSELDTTAHQYNIDRTTSKLFGYENSHMIESTETVKFHGCSYEYRYPPDAQDAPTP